MGQVVQGVIARSKGAPVEVVSVHVPNPGPGEALVKIQACGVCHTDLHYREGVISSEFPIKSVFQWFECSKLFTIVKTRAVTQKASYLFLDHFVVCSFSYENYRGCTTY